MRAMRAVLLAKTIVSHIGLTTLFLSSHATRIVAYFWIGHAALRLNPCVRMARTWLIPSVKVSVTLCTQELRTRIGGPVPTELKSVSFKPLVVTGIQIVMMLLKKAMPAMNRIVQWSARLA